MHAQLHLDVCAVFHRIGKRDVEEGVVELFVIEFWEVESVRGERGV